MCIDYLSFSVSAVSQQYINIETVSKSTCNSDTADNIVNFLNLEGQYYTDHGQGFVTVCLKKNSSNSSYGWALIHDDNRMTDQLKLGVMHAACRQNGYFGSPDRKPKSSMYVYHCRLLLLI